MLTIKVLFASFLSLVLLPFAHAQSVTVCNDYFPPFVERQGEPPGEATKLMAVLLHDMGYDVTYEYMNWDYCHYRVQKGESVITFPWLWNKERAERVHFTGVDEIDGKLEFNDGFFKADEGLFYNRRNRKAVDLARVLHATNDISDMLSKMAEINESGGAPFKIGVIKNYEYSRKVSDNLINAISEGQQGAVLVELNSETESIETLLDNSVDFIVFIERVMEKYRAMDFPEERELIQKVNMSIAPQEMRIMVPRNAFGEQFLVDFEKSYSRLMNADVLPIPASGVQNAMRSEIATVQSSDGHPIIIACLPEANTNSDTVNETEEDVCTRRQPKCSGKHIAILHGTDVSVLNWSNMLKCPTDEKIYPIMKGWTFVVVLEGAHSGTEVLIENMYLSLSE